MALVLGTQPLALLFVFITWHRWTGRSQRWLEGRRFGWAVTRSTGYAFFFQGWALSGLSQMLDDNEALLLLGGLGWIVIGPALVLVGLLWTPLFALPWWIRERLTHGDPVRTSEPPCRIQPDLRAPQNQPRPTKEDVAPQERHDLGGWIFGVVISAVCAIFFACLVIGVGPVNLDIGARVSNRGTRIVVTESNQIFLQLFFAVLSVFSTVLSVVFAREVPAQWRKRKQLRAAAATPTVDQHD